MDASAQSFFIASVDAFGGNSGSGVFGADGAECVVVNEVPAPSVDNSEGESVVYAWAGMNALCRREPALSICGELCPDRGGGGGCSVDSPGSAAGGSGLFGFTALGLIAVIARRRR